jgi:hypothetical protein
MAELKLHEIDAQRRLIQKGELLEDYLEEKVLNRLEQVQQAVRRTLVRVQASDENLTEKEILSIFENELEFKYVPPVPIVITDANLLEVNVRKDGTVSYIVRYPTVNSLQVDRLPLMGYGLDRRLAGDDWELSLTNANGEEVFKAPANDLITRHGGGFAEDLELTRAFASAPQGAKGIAEGEYTLTLRNVYGDTRSAISIPVRVKQNVALDTRTVKQIPPQTLKLSKVVDPDFEVTVKDYETRQPKLDGFGDGRVGDRVKVWRFPHYPHIGNNDVSFFEIPISRDPNLWKSAMVTVEVELKVSDDQRTVALNMTAHVAEWEEENDWPKKGFRPKSDFSGGRAFVPIPLTVPGLREDEAIYGIQGKHRFTQSKYCWGDWYELSMNCAPDDVVRSVTGPIIPHGNAFEIHMGGVWYPTIKLDISDVVVEVGKRQ